MSTKVVKKREKSTSPERSKKVTSESSTTSSTSFGRYLVRFVIVMFALLSAYNIRLHALETYGNVIHEFDPWFNYRATVYLRDHGVEKFFKWYDHKVW
jgi:asparagine N-glycosylation enzyme membrane subunit Stt3